jgi:hypothetical protein
VRAAAVAVATALLALSGSAAALRLPTAPRCPIFPASNPWNSRVDRLPVAANSRTIIDSIGADDGVWADFGSGLLGGVTRGIPFNVVAPRQPLKRVAFDNANSDLVRYPIPKHVRIEGGVDDHALIIDRGRCRLYELYDLRRSATGWRAYSGATWSLRSNRLRPRGKLSADAAGLPIFPGLARYDEVARGRIDHALRFTVRRTRGAYIYPARHHGRDPKNLSLPPMGLRVRLRADYPLDGFPPQARVVLVALKRYGMIVADNGTNWVITGAPDPRWSNQQLDTLNQVKGSDFEVVNTNSLRP